jgi:hypothetical protein
MAEPILPPARYETADVTFRFVLFGAAGVLTMILLCTFAVMWLYPSAIQDRRIPSVLPVYPAPRLEANPQAVLKRFQAEELSSLNSTGWIDKDLGIAHIPIDEAMQQIAQKGIADWPASSATGP